MYEHEQIRRYAKALRVNRRLRLSADRYPATDVHDLLIDISNHMNERLYAERIGAFYVVRFRDDTHKHRSVG